LRGRRFLAGLPASLKPQERAVRNVFHSCSPDVVALIEQGCAVYDNYPDIGWGIDANRTGGLRPPACRYCLHQEVWTDHDQVHWYFGTLRFRPPKSTMLGTLAC